MGGPNRGRYAVQLGDAWRLYQVAPMQGWEMLGVIERDGECGALARSRGPVVHRLQIPLAPASA